MTTQERNAKICQEYREGATFYDLGQKYQLSRQWLHKILEKNNVPIRPRAADRIGRDTFLGANIGEQTKKDVAALAKEKGTSVSALTDQALQDLLKKESA